LPTVATFEKRSPRRSPALTMSPASPPLCETIATAPSVWGAPSWNVCRPAGQ
jgi:hypothetical protein